MHLRVVFRKLSFGLETHAAGGTLELLSESKYHLYRKGNPSFAYLDICFDTSRPKSPVDRILVGEWKYVILVPRRAEHYPPTRIRRCCENGDFTGQRDSTKAGTPLFLLPPNPSRPAGQPREPVCVLDDDIPSRVEGPEMGNQREIVNA